MLVNFYLFKENMVVGFFLPKCLVFPPSSSKYPFLMVLSRGLLDKRFGLEKPERLPEITSGEIIPRCHPRFTYVKKCYIHYTRVQGFILQKHFTRPLESCILISFPFCLRPYTLFFILISFLLYLMPYALRLTPYTLRLRPFLFYSYIVKINLLLFGVVRDKDHHSFNIS